MDAFTKMVPRQVIPISAYERTECESGQMWLAPCKSVTYIPTHSYGVDDLFADPRRKPRGRRTMRGARGRRGFNGSSLPIQREHTLRRCERAVIPMGGLRARMRRSHRSSTMKSYVPEIRYTGYWISQDVSSGSSVRQSLTTVAARDARWDMQWFLEWTARTQTGRG